MAKYGNKAYKFRTIPILRRKAVQIDVRQKAKANQTITPPLGVQLKSPTRASKPTASETRKDGIKQIAKAIAGENPAIGTALMIKDIGMGVYKVAKPKDFQKDNLAKQIDEF